MGQLLLLFLTFANAQISPSLGAAPASATSSSLDWLEVSSPERLQWLRDESHKTGLYLKDHNTLYQQLLKTEKYGNEPEFQDSIETSEPASAAPSDSTTQANADSRKIIVKQFTGGYGHQDYIEVSNSNPFSPINYKISISDLVKKSIGSTHIEQMYFSDDEKYLELYLNEKGGITYFELFLIELRTGKVVLEIPNTETIYWQNPEQFKYGTRGNGERLEKLHTMGKPIADDEITLHEVLMLDEEQNPVEFDQKIISDAAGDYSTHASANGNGEVIYTNSSTNAVRVVIPEKNQGVIEFVAVAAPGSTGNLLVVKYQWGEWQWLEVFNYDGLFQMAIPLPRASIYNQSEISGDIAKVTVRGFLSDAKTFTFSRTANSYLDEKNMPLSLEDVEKLLLTDKNGNEYVVESLEVRTRDGVTIPIVTYRNKKTAMNGKVPTLIEVYAGFGLSQIYEDDIDAMVKNFLNEGGMYVSAGLRGGYERGRGWYLDGVREKKSNSPKDLIAVTEYLIANHYTRAKNIAITGTSNGGLVVGSALALRPDLFGLAIPVSGVLDMLRKDVLDPVNGGWGGEYLRADTPEHIAILKSYGPLYNVKPAVYPTVLIIAGQTDDRVNPVHSYKFAAALQKAQLGPAPILLDAYKNSGHWLSNQPVIEFTVQARMWTVIKSTIFTKD
jgi:protease II